MEKDWAAFFGTLLTKWVKENNYINFWLQIALGIAYSVEIFYSSYPAPYEPIWNQFLSDNIELE